MRLEYLWMKTCAKCAQPYARMHALAVEMCKMDLRIARPLPIAAGTTADLFPRRMEQASEARHKWLRRNSKTISLQGALSAECAATPLLRSRQWHAARCH